MTATGISDDVLLGQDDAARKEALDVTRSFLVQAPAGSGKTDLLTKRFLALLSVVQEPDEILAITFTRAATAEMRSRILGELQVAQTSIERGEPPKNELAARALERAKQRGWFLLEQPQRLNIKTLDALCLAIGYEAPLLSQLGGQLQPVDDARPMYAMAARRTLERLGGSNAALSAALEHLLRLREVNLNNVEGLIADMLQQRDQWLQELGSERSLSDAEWADVRQKLEEPFQLEHTRVFGSLRTYFLTHDQKFTTLLRLLAHACQEGEVPPDFHAVAAFQGADELVELAHFKCVRDFLLTQSDTWRKKGDKSIGFLALKNGGSRERHAEFKQLLVGMSEIEGLHPLLCEVDCLPESAFSNAEWQTIRSIFTVLLQAVGELRVVFAEHSRIDFVEAGITAAQALGDPEVRRRWSSQVHHLLVDEFQDTSRRQYELLREIVRDWEPQEQRTCFLVGDPMQSIYLFRNADLALFDEAREHGFGRDLPHLRLEHLTLSRNFRSTAGIVEPINRMFDPSMQNGAEGARRFTPARANDDTPEANAMLLHTHFFTDNDAEKAEAMEAEAAEAVSIIASHLPALARARAAHTNYRVGVLVRVKAHVELIAAALRSKAIPFRAVELGTLKDRQEIRDVLALIRALLHPLDRIAWLAVLRAPWCGLTLADLHMLSGDDNADCQARPVRELLDSRIQLLSEDGQTRARRVQKVLELALANRFSGQSIAAPNGFAAWIERTWTMLGGPACVKANAYVNVEALFRLLAELTPLEATSETLAIRLENLFAQPDPAAPENCSVQIMTIHKAKGLGFDVVLVPGLNKIGKGTDSPLLRRMTRTRRSDAVRELLIAPIGSKATKPWKTYDWIGKQIEMEERAEVHRLLYVACTRARTELHLFAAIKVKEKPVEGMAPNLEQPQKGTMLLCGWEYLRPFAEQDYAEQDYAEQTDLVTEAKLEGLHLVAPAKAEPDQLDGIFDIAAAVESQVQPWSRAPHSTRAQKWTRLPTSWIRAAEKSDIVQASEGLGIGQDVFSQDGPQRRLGSLASRARGTVLHALFEACSLLPEADPRRDIASSLAHWTAVTRALLQNAGLSRRDVDEELKTVLAMLGAAIDDPYARWILGQRRHARSEGAWTMKEHGRLVTVRCDRVFLAGAEPLVEGEDHVWIVDYKSADSIQADSFLEEEQERFAPQLARYAAALRMSSDTLQPVMLALYYPALRRLRWWPA